MKSGCLYGKYISLPLVFMSCLAIAGILVMTIRDICPGDPLDIKCCVPSKLKLLQSGSRPASSTIDSNSVHIPGIAHPNLPDTIIIPDSSTFDPQDQSDVNDFFIQHIQLETPSTDTRASDPMSDGDPSFLGDFPDDELMTSLPEGSNLEPDSTTDSFTAGQGNAPISDPYSPIFPSPGPSSDDAQLASYVFGEDDGQESPGFPGQG